MTILICLALFSVAVALPSSPTPLNSISDKEEIQVIFDALKEKVHTGGYGEMFTIPEIKQQELLGLLDRLNEIAIATSAMEATVGAYNKKVIFATLDLLDELTRAFNTKEDEGDKRLKDTMLKLIDNLRGTVKKEPDDVFSTNNEYKAVLEEVLLLLRERSNQDKDLFLFLNRLNSVLGSLIYEISVCVYRGLLQ